MRGKRSKFATAAVVAVVLGVFALLTGHPFLSLLAGLVAIPLGLFGLLFAASPRTRGGLISLGSAVGGLLLSGLAMLGIIGAIVF